MGIAATEEHANGRIGRSPSRTVGDQLELQEASGLPEQNQGSRIRAAGSSAVTVRVVERHVLDSTCDAIREAFHLPTRRPKVMNR